MRPSFEYMTYLQYTNKALEKEVESLRSGKAFVKLRDDYHKMLDERDRLIRELRQVHSACHRELGLFSLAFLLSDTGPSHVSSLSKMRSPSS